ncbi:hypothetical protein [Lutibacter sp. B1]|uniref:hypothetical protein n=1 Tax=Lutibacter sp. B1 TaxID=2725996 RepID=UPI001457447F|nr:hypothetical protein [Lutibacter sp. B1]NLP57967.1 hypothetical protein [Lutibacter sp. B1]
MKNLTKILVVIFSVFALASCKQNNSYTKINNSKTAANVVTHKIVVNEFKDADMYTYINVTEEGKNYWMAIPKTEVKIGDIYYYDGGMVMKNFESKQFNKTFETITFADAVRTTEERVKTEINPHGNSDKNTLISNVKIEKPKNGISLEELFKDKDAHSNKFIVVKGVVTKVNKEILEKNWIHIVDGTTFENKKSLTIASTELAKVGDTVTFKGKVTLNKDFGYGYIYDILLEEGELVE